MVIYKNDILCDKCKDGALIPICWVDGEHKYSYIDDYGFKECGMGKYYQSNYNEADVRKIKAFAMDGKFLIWDFDNGETNAKKLRDDNLYLVDKRQIKPIWNMRETVGYTDTCVSVSIVSESIFSFVIFNGIRYTMEIEDMQVKTINMNITK